MGDAKMPAFMRKRVSRAEADSPPTSKVSRLIGEAKGQAMASTGGKGDKGKGGGKRGEPSKESIMWHLMTILTRLVLQNSNDIREICGMMLVTCLVPLNHVLAKASLDAGVIYQEMVNDNKSKKKAQAKDEEESDEAMEVDQLQAPYHFIALQAMMAWLETDRTAMEPALQAAIGALDVAWKKHINEVKEDELFEVIRVWRCRKPQKQRKQKGMVGEFAKLVFSIHEELEIPLRQALGLSGGQVKAGKPPRSWLEREAAKLLDIANKA
jgi:hypothetical protein